jgi:pSer/pThr/pTyr-binding forkhead associated (FHA) protein
LYCTHCGHRNPEDARFCASCGQPLQGSVQEDATASLTPVDGEEDPHEDLTLPPEDLEKGQALLLVRRGPNAGSRFLIDQDATSAGRHPDSDIFLDDITVSRRHAEILRRDERFFLKDDGSLNGTYLNRKRVDESELTNGDEIQIGKFKLAFFRGE